jgi:hypothetical protein
MITVFDMASGQEDVAATQSVEVAQAASTMTNPAVQLQLRLLTLDEAVAVEQHIGNQGISSILMVP